MSKIILLNDEDGSFYKELPLISLPPGFVVPEGKTLRWTDTVEVDMMNMFMARANNRPATALFHFGSATAEVTPDEQSDKSVDNELRVDPDLIIPLLSGRKFIITVQSKSPRELEALRAAVIGLVTTGQPYSSVNDFNPKPKKPRIGLVGRCRRLLFGDS